MASSKNPTCESSKIKKSQTFLYAESAPKKGFFLMTFKTGEDSEGLKNFKNRIIIDMSHVNRITALNALIKKNQFKFPCETMASSVRMCTKDEPCHKCCGLLDSLKYAYGLEKVTQKIPSKVPSKVEPVCTKLLEKSDKFIQLARPTREKWCLGFCEFTHCNMGFITIGQFNRLIEILNSDLCSYSPALLRYGTSFFRNEQERQDLLPFFEGCQHFQFCVYLQRLRHCMMAKKECRISNPSSATSTVLPTSTQTTSTMSSIVPYRIPSTCTSTVPSYRTSSTVSSIMPYRIPTSGSVRFRRRRARSAGDNDKNPIIID